MKKIKEITYRKAKEIQNEHNVQVNEDKTENTTIKICKKEFSFTRLLHVSSSKLGDQEDIIRRKQLATIAMRDN